MTSFLRNAFAAQGTFLEKIVGNENIRFLIDFLDGRLQNPYSKIGKSFIRFYFRVEKKILHGYFIGLRRTGLYFSLMKIHNIVKSCSVFALQVELMRRIDFAVLGFARADEKLVFLIRLNNPLDE